MAIVKNKPDSVEVPKDVPNVIEKPVHKSILIDTAYIPRINIITQINGAPWKVDYYAQVINDDTQLAGHNPTRDKINQAYTKTAGLILRVTSPLQQSQDQKTNAFIVNGTANTYPGLYPNQGDMFVADIGDGRLGIFRVINVEGKSYFKDATSTIDYQLISFADGDHASRFKDLEDKVVETRHFVMEQMDYNQSPYLKSDDYHTYDFIKQQYQELIHHYFRIFISRQYKCLLVPGQSSLVYDPFLTRFMMRAFDNHVHPAASDIRSFNTGDDGAINLPTVFEMFLERDADLLSYCTTKVCMLTVQAFNGNPFMQGIRYSGMREIVYPLNPVPDADTEIYVQPNNRLKTRNGFTPSNDLKTISNYQNTPLIHRAHSSEYYIFSRAFYDKNGTGMSVLEAQIWTYLNNKPVDQNAIKAILNEYHNWGKLEKFYYTPFILVLMQSIIRGI